MSVKKNKPQNVKVVEEKFIVEYENAIYDITEFMSKHPGGVNTLIGYNHKNIEDRFKGIDHSPAAEYLLNDYKMKNRPEEFNNNLDDSMEHLVDWNKGLLNQITNLGDRYTDWVNKPLDRRLKLFDNNFLESLTKTPWYMPLLFWIPIVLFLIVEESTTYTYSNSAIFLHVTAGVILWTILEYTLHRFLFHMNVKKHPKWATFHFMIHGLHHKVPFDENRLVFPPFPAAILATALYQPIKFLISTAGLDWINPRLVLSGALVGYLVYDMIHYYLHHGSPRIKYFYNLKRYHHNHHFVNHDTGFGISSTAWDSVLGTKIILKKLKYLMKW